ncbi:hypothetical protein [Bacillus mycoides]|uniref:hypothetical protein n=1 Tax=Bacillus mycoides TaxID=1405 RepID=UPI0011A07FD2|nr:hypothetical protein [Bacillus mycoides]
MTVIVYGNWLDEVNGEILLDHGGDPFKKEHACGSVATLRIPVLLIEKIYPLTKCPNGKFSYEVVIRSIFDNNQIDDVVVEKCSDQVRYERSQPLS